MRSKKRRTALTKWPFLADYNICFSNIFSCFYRSDISVLWAHVLNNLIFFKMLLLISPEVEHMVFLQTQKAVADNKKLVFFP